MRCFKILKSSLWMKVLQKILVKSKMHEKCKNATLQKFCPHCVTPTFLCVTLLQVVMYAYTCLTRFYLRLDLQRTFWNCKKVEKKFKTVI